MISMENKITQKIQEIIDISDSVLKLLLFRSNDLDKILSHMQAREDLMNEMILLVSGAEKYKLLEVLRMIRDKEMEAIAPYAKELKSVEDSLIAVNKLSHYQGLAGSGKGA